MTIHPIPHYLDSARDQVAALGITSDEGLAHLLGVSRVTLSEWRRNKLVPAEEACYRLAAAAGVHVVEVMLSAAAARERNAGRSDRHWHAVAATLQASPYTPDRHVTTAPASHPPENDGSGGRRSR